MKRTPKNYDGIRFPAKKIDGLVKGFLDGFSSKKGVQKDEVFKAWYAIIGERLKGLTKPISFFEGTLIVSVKSQTLYSLLCTHEKKRVLEELQRKFSKKMIKDVLFRIG